MSLKCNKEARLAENDVLSDCYSDYERLRLLEVLWKADGLEMIASPQKLHERLGFVSTPDHSSPSYWMCS